MANDVVRLKSIPLWDPPWGRAELARRRRAGKRAFDRGFFLKAYSDDELTFPSFGKCERPGLLVSQMVNAAPGWRAFTGVDISGSKRPGNAIVTTLVDPQHRRYLADVRFGRWRGRAFADQIDDVVRVWKPVVVMVEDNGVQQMLLDWIADSKARYSFWTILEGTTTTAGTKFDAETGLPGLELEFSNGAWTFPLSEYEDLGGDTIEEDPLEQVGRSAFARLADEFRFHPTWRTSDGVMATMFSRQGIELYRGLSSDDELAGLNQR